MIIECVGRKRWRSIRVQAIHVHGLEILGIRDIGVFNLGFQAKKRSGQRGEMIASALLPMSSTTIGS